MNTKIKEYSPSAVIGFIGLSHLGLVSSSVLSSLGTRTICFDSDGTTITKLKKFITKIDEPGLLDILKSNKSLQTFTSDINALLDCDLIYISQDVEIDNKSLSNLTQIESMITEICNLIRSDIPIVILSQSIPGFCEQISNNQKNPIYYQVETLVFGEAVKRAKNPERIIIGKKSQYENLPACYLEVLELFKCPVIEMDYVSAELTKIAINIYLASDVAITNSLAEICKIIGGDWNKVINAIKLDKRIGKYRYLNPGLGLSGGNIERDLNAITMISSQSGSQNDIFEALMASSVYYRNWAIRIVQELGRINNQIKSFGFWGLSYKPFTNSIRNSPALMTIKCLQQGSKVFVHDPLVTYVEVQGCDIQQVADALEMISRIDVLLILCPWPDYKDIFDRESIKILKEKIIIDPFFLIDDNLCKEFNIKHYTFYSSRQH